MLVIKSYIMFIMCIFNVAHFFILLYIRLEKNVHTLAISFSISFSTWKNQKLWYKTVATNDIKTVVITTED